MRRRRLGFRQISSLSLSSFRLRQMTLKCCFATFRPRSPRQWACCTHICSTFDSRTTDLSSEPAYLANLTNLGTLELDFSGDGLATQSQRAELLIKVLPPTLTVFRLVCLPRIDTHILSLIAARCPALETLDMTVVDRLDKSCCWYCLEESSTCTVHSPIPDMYPNVNELSIAFATALQPLKQLHHLYLGVCLSDSDVFDAHIGHCCNNDPAGSGIVPFAPEECLVCAEERHEIGVRKRELMASAVMGGMLSSLQTISWASWFVQSEPGDDFVNQLTTVWIRRADGAVHVRRAPW
ncbi:hypothetical protein FOMPIDRAFT_1121547 [Fomitopsis schrenkii]|uniref:F-box domain-containing protein n=1 Tax=Fomitopsis schrenkii TaxID=2126942 RepID=S8FRW9_FOMSC|nr:hypothetical protein FOMPIDRAFT_1121547 [Fomitopsis schrenkii]